MANYYSIKTKDANSVNKILDKGSGIELDGLNVLQEAMVRGQMVFLVLGGDKPAWDTGLIGIGKISEEPYDVGYSGKNYKVKVDVIILLDRALKREDFLSYRDTYGTIGIGPITKWEPNQALSQVQEKNAIALMRAMLELCPASKQEFDEFLSDEEKAKVYSPTTKMIEVPFEYGQTQEQAIKMFVEKNDDDFEERNKKMFREWMTKQVKPEGDSDAGNPYAESSVNAYVDVVSRQMIILEGQEKSLFATVDFDTVNQVVEEEAQKPDTTKGRRVSALRKYRAYVEEYNSDSSEEEISEITDMDAFVEPDFCTGFECDFDRNRIVFGAPGTGKSYKLKQESEDLIGCAGKHMERVTFHSDYSYSQFVGSYKPVTDAVGNIRYDFVPGPFMRVYVNAVKNIQQMARVYDAIAQADTMYMFPTNPNPANVNEKWDLFEEITEVGQKETFRASKEAKVGDLALIYVADTKPGYDNGIYAIGEIVSKKEDIATIRFDYVSYYWPIIDYETLKAYNPNIRSNGRVSDNITALVKEAFIPANPHLLLIEEINRAKVAAVFGDVFQLLDRDDDGVSEYEIQTSEDVRKYLASQLGGEPENWLKIKLPDNMFIWATMNSADQGVFPMDTAFKRRWSFEYLGINDSEDEDTHYIKLGKDETEIEWNWLRRAINDKLAKEYKVNEDKLMGPYFLSKKVIAADEEGYIENPDGFIKAFKSKVIMYLYEDAAKQHKHKLFSGCDNSKYSSVCDAFDEIGIGIFGEDFKAQYYDPQEE